MEALFALGVACNVMQVISFCHETVSLSIKIYKKGSSDPELAQHVLQMKGLANQLDSAISNSATVITIQSPPRKELIAIARDCASTAKELELELNQVSHSKIGAVGRAVKIRFRISKLETLKQKLVSHQNTLQLRLIFEIWYVKVSNPLFCFSRGSRNKQDAAAIQEQDAFAALDEKVKNLIENFAQGQIQIQNLIQTDNAKVVATVVAGMAALQQQISSDGNKTRQHVTDVVTDVQSSVEARRALEEKKSMFLKSLWFDAMNDRKTSIGESYPETFEWIFSSEDGALQSKYRTWLSSKDERIFWIKGKPGSGKSTLMKFLQSDKRTLMHLENWLPSCATYSIFIWNSGKKMQKTLKGIFCSLIHQILEVEKNEFLLFKLLNKEPRLSTKKSHYDWELRELEEILQYILQWHKDPVCLFIDGLDEIDRDENRFGLKQIVEKSLAQIDHLKICVSSRPEPFWVNMLDNCSSMSLPELTKFDLERLAKDLLKK
jgi:hypothetical protein